MRIAIIDWMHRRRAALAVATLAAVFLAVYLPDIGHGFVKDDFGWVRRAALDAWPDLLLRSDIGFYRPLVMATFAADHAVYGLNAFGYGMTNLAVAVADAALLAALVRRLSLPAAAAVLGAAAWAFNFHGMNMGLLWLSGRTALLVVLFSLATAHAVLRDRTWLAGVFCLGALLSKEEATLLPALWTAVLAAEGRAQRSTQRPEGFGSGPAAPGHDSQAGRRALRAWPLWAALAIYLALRAGSGAFGALDAPDEYRLYSSIPLLLQNLREYADRAGTLFAVLAIVLFAVAASRAPFSAAERRALLLALIWIPATFALTVSLPVRSSLYVLLPSIGSALALAAVASRTLRLVPRRFDRLSAVLVVLAILLVPVYRARNDRWVEDAELSARVVELARTAAARYPAGGQFLLVDDPSVRPNFDSAFLTAIPEVLTLHAGPRWTGRIVAEGEPVPEDAVIVRLESGQPLATWP